MNERMNTLLIKYFIMKRPNHIFLHSNLLFQITYGDAGGARRILGHEDGPQTVEEGQTQKWCFRLVRILFLFALIAFYYEMLHYAGAHSL